jgi:hypothetical protein
MMPRRAHPPGRSRLSAGLLLPLLALLLATGACGDDPTSPEPPEFPPADGTFSQAEIDYYVEIALGSELGNASRRVRKWGEEVVLEVRGAPGEADRAELERVVTELNGLLAEPEVRIAGPGEGGQAVIHFAPESTFEEIDSRYVPVNLGFVWITWDGSDRIRTGLVLVDNTDRIDQATRNHLIREEVTQMLGLLQDSPRISGSIFFGSFRPSPTEYLPIDRAVLRMHGDPRVQRGMTETELRFLLPTL